MKNKTILIMIAFVLLINLYSISAVSYFQTKSNEGNNTIRIHSFVQNGEDGTSEHIKDNKALEVYVLYRGYIDTWNQKNIYNRVSSCNIMIGFSPKLYNGTINVLNQTFIGNIPDTKYFVLLNKGDSFEVDMTCSFESSIPTTLEIPADFSIVTPTWECKACQYYEWSLTERSVAKAETLGDFTITIMENIRQIFKINFSIILALFWVLLILLFLVVIGLIFTGIFWICLFLYRWVK